MEEEMKTIKIQYKDLSKNSNTPILTYCRKLMEEGESYDTRLEVFREQGDFDVVIPKIGLGASLTVREEPYLHITKYTIPKVNYRNSP